MPDPFSFTIFLKRENMVNSKIIKADIIPYNSGHSSLVHSWIDDEKCYYNLCLGKGYPPPEDLVDSWQRNAVKSYLIVTGGEPVAYGELWDKPFEMAVEIAHLLVDPARRSLGYGTRMIELLFELASQRKALASVHLNLFVDSKEALNCYLSAGFELVGAANYTTGLKMIRMIK